MPKKAAARAVLESDSNYFHLGAETRCIGALRLFYLPGLTEAASGCVAFASWGADGPAIDARSILELEAAARRVGAPIVRLYDPGQAPMGRRLSDLGYRATAEVVLVCKAFDTDQPTVELVPVSDHGDWERKKRLHEDAGPGPDGHHTRADVWVECRRSNQPLMHAGNDAWKRAGSIVRMRVVLAVYLAFVVSFFVTMAVAPLFGGSVHPDLPVAERPPTLFGLDGNALGFLVVLPFVLLAWRAAERGANGQ